MCNGMRFSRLKLNTIGSPYLLSCIIFFIIATPGLNLSMYPHVSKTLFLFAISASFIPSETSYVMGFSTKTCFLDSIIRDAISTCVKVGVQTNAASKSSDFSNSSMVSYAGTEYLEENSLHISAFPSHIAPSTPISESTRA